MDRWKWVVIDVGVILDTSASHSENFLFPTFLGAGWGTSRPDLRVPSEFLNVWCHLGPGARTQPGYEQISSQQQETIVKSEPLMTSHVWGKLSKSSELKNPTKCSSPI